MIRAFFFDFDGTLADTEPLHLEAYRRLLAPYGVRIEDAEYEARYLQGTDRECLERMLVDYDRPELRRSLESLLRRKHELMAALLGETPLLAGAEACVASAAAIGPVALVTGGLGAVVVPYLHRRGLHRHFATIVTAEDVRRGKPDPEGFALALARIRETSLPDLRAGECLVFEDSPSGIDAARSAGMHVVALTRSTSAERLAGADRVVASFAEIDVAAVRDRFA